jgi:hypothetical protein
MGLRLHTRSWPRLSGLLLTAVLSAAAAPAPPSAVPPSAVPPSAVPPSAVPPSAVAQGRALEYVSDFFCFVGGDELGRAVFAFDVNRGRQGERTQAEYFAALWVEGQGWRELEGTGQFRDPEQRFYELPSTATFQLSGWAADGLTVESAANQLGLRVEPVVRHTRSRRGQAVFSSGSSAGELRLGERRIQGRVSYEYCFLPDRNPLVKTYTDLFGDGYHGLYGVVGATSSGADLRFHQTGGWLEPLVAARDGFLRRDGSTERIAGASFEIADKRLGGFFRWPGRYRVGWSPPQPEEPGPVPPEPAPEGSAAPASAPRRLDVALRDRETILNYVFGGVAVAIAEGELIQGEQREAVFGLALIVR